MKVTLFRAFPDSYRKSMSVYGDLLLAALRSFLPPGDEAIGFLPRHVFLGPRPARYWAQYIGYQLSAPFAQGDVNHVIDHAYGHLLYTLDPARTVVTFHDAIGLKARDGHFGHSGGDRSLSLVQRYNLSGLRKAAAVICDSEASRKDFLAYTGYRSEQVEVIPPGADGSFFRQSNSDPKGLLGLVPGRYLLHVGHTRFYKNIPALFHVLAILTQSLGYDVKLLKVGEAFTAEQEKLADDLGIRDRIVHLGMVADDLLPDVYRSADLLLFPSWYEGFGLPVLEAMASGVPVVASNRGSLPEVVGDAGVLVDPEDHETMAKSVAMILDDAGFREKLRQAGLERARLFTWEKTAKQTLEVYRKVYQASQ
ncbi:MAG TPA: glycosyltransferase family 1 protein [Pyrinomonadaceae bacterium]|nr:glycosyltransferase family 1 protein [Pyrinomonadaceae bacterium]